MIRKFKVESMMCEKCVARVKKALESVDGVDTAKVTLDDKLAVVTLSSDIADSVLIDAVTALGHTAVLA